MTILQAYEIESTELPAAIMQAFADSVKFMMDPAFTGLDVRNPETGVGEEEVSFQVNKVNTYLYDEKAAHFRILGPSEVVINKKKLNALQLHLLQEILK